MLHYLIISKGRSEPYPHLRGQTYGQQGENGVGRGVGVIWEIGIGTYIIGIMDKMDNKWEVVV